VNETTGSPVTEPLLAHILGGTASPPSALARRIQLSKDNQARTQIKKPGHLSMTGSETPSRLCIVTITSLETEAAEGLGLTISWV
jgi:hypothetical protein